MNCKPGDMAIVIGTSRYAGLLVEVLHEAPPHEFYLPDGYHHVEPEPHSWVIKSLGSPFIAPLGNGMTRNTMYGVGRDSKLRPLPGETKTQTKEREVST